MANGAFKYTPQDWQNYNPNWSMEVNTEVGGVITPERLDHMEEGLVHANMPIIIEIKTDPEVNLTSTTEADGRRYLEVITSEVEPRHSSMSIIINPVDPNQDNENNTVIEDDNKAKSRVITVDTTSVEPRWPAHLQIQLIPYQFDSVQIIDEEETDTRKIQIRSSFLDSLCYKPAEREIVLYMDDWVLNEATGLYEINLVHIEAEVKRSSFVKFTRGEHITKQQLKAIDDCGIKFVEHLNGTFKATAVVKPILDIPFHASVLNGIGD